MGYEEGGRLTETVRRRPYCVLLLNEMEKAHPRIFDLFLQVLEDGRLTDGHGRTVNFRNTLIIMTSNVGSAAIFAAGGDPDKATVEIQEALRAYFRPEFLNRIDEVVTFRSLDEADMSAVAKIQMARVEAQLTEKRIGLEYGPEALHWLAKEGFDPQLGARPLKRLIQHVVVNPLSRLILEDRLRPGSLAVLKVENDGLKVDTQILQ